MRFFQRLAPAARTQHAVQPALPPRFATMGPRLDDDHAMTFALAARSDPSREEPAREGALDQPWATRARTSDGHEAPSPQPSPPAGARERPPLPLAGEGRGEGPHEASKATTREHAAPPRVSGPVRGTEPASKRVDAASAHGDDPRSLPTLARPLTPLALAQRVSPAKSEPTVVHVTIDRIDVRAPAPAHAPRAAAKPRATPSVSLADYLRRGKS